MEQDYYWVDNKWSKAATLLPGHRQSAIVYTPVVSPDKDYK